MLLYAMPISPADPRLNGHKLSLNSMRVRSSEPTKRLSFISQWRVDHEVYQADYRDLAVEVCGQRGVYIYRDAAFITMDHDSMQIMLRLCDNQEDFHHLAKICASQSK